MRYSDTLETLSNWERFLKWVKANLKDSSVFDRIDWSAEVDRSLTLDEAIGDVRSRFADIWKDKGGKNKVKQIVFIEPLIDKIIAGEVTVTYRGSPKSGYYYVVDNRFKKTKERMVIIELYKSELVDPKRLSDKDALAAGIETSSSLLKLLQKWYGNPLPKIYRNYFRLVDHSDGS